MLSVEGFFEWRDCNKKKYPYFISIKEEEIFSLGCIYEECVDKLTGEIRNTFSIITTPANPMMSAIHNLKNRMPLIIDRKNEIEWIDPKLDEDKVKELIKPFSQEKMKAHTISNDANIGNRNRNIPEIVNPIFILNFLNFLK